MSTCKLRSEQMCNGTQWCGGSAHTCRSFIEFQTGWRAEIYNQMPSLLWACINCKGFCLVFFAHDELAYSSKYGG